jgi:hypothetical protein
MPGKFVPLFEPLPGKSGKKLSPDFSGGKFCPAFARSLSHYPKSSQGFRAMAQRTVIKKRKKRIP